MGQWKLGTVVKTFPGEDGRVRRVHVQHKNPKPGEAVNEYHGRSYVTLGRAVHKLIVDSKNLNISKKLNSCFGKIK